LIPDARVPGSGLPFGARTMPRARSDMRLTFAMAGWSIDDVLSALQVLVRTAQLSSSLHLQK
jgi:hypothetical protein